MTHPSPDPARCRYFLGGHDLEMQEIRQLLAGAGLAKRVADANLSWGARASAYEAELLAALALGETPVLVELEDDLGPGIERGRLILIDHHGARAGQDQPSSLRQLFDLIAPRLNLHWTRRMALVAANDIGHAPGLRAMGADAGEIRAIRDADRQVQGVSPETEMESRRAIKAALWSGPLLVVETSAPTSSAITDFLLGEYGGANPDNILVIMPEKLAFFGSGKVIAALAPTQGCWYGGALPVRGYWGAPRQSVPDSQALAARIVALIDQG